MLKQVIFATAALFSSIAFAQDVKPVEPVAPAAAPAAEAAPAPAPAPNPRVAVHTNMGDIAIELFPEKAPKSVENFLQYVRDKHYDGTVFHRVIGDFMIQGGGFTPDLRQKPTREAIPNEANNGLSNTLGTVAMARTTDPNSATAQFFINVVDNSRLDHVSTENGYTWGYAVFGKVTEGMDVVDRIKAVETGPAGPLDKSVPKSPVLISSIEILP